MITINSSSNTLFYEKNKKFEKKFLSDYEKYTSDTYNRQKVDEV